MLGFNDLKEHILVTPSTVQCPVRNCTEKVARQRKIFLREAIFKCPIHNIYISPSTWEYEYNRDNLLWTDETDLFLLEQILAVKRESRMARDNSEDAVTWNVFRFLERQHLIEPVLSSILNIPLSSAKVIYWSYSQKESKQWLQLNQARKEFGETIKRGSEPDIIITTDKQLLFIEAKFKAMNITKPSVNSKVDCYVNGANRWFSTVFNTDFQTIAIQKQKYELLRFWLLGTWIADQNNLEFYLLNLVLSENEKEIEPNFKPLIRESQSRHFKRITWEDIYSKILKFGISNPDQQNLIDYFENKTIGYNAEGNLQHAFHGR
ncbi:MAG: hypothetical protein ACE14V_13710 [bacterium]